MAACTDGVSGGELTLLSRVNGLRPTLLGYEGGEPGNTGAGEFGSAVFPANSASPDAPTGS